MLDISIIKESILAGTLGDDILIFLNKKDSFLAWQYVKEISKRKNLDIVQIDELPKGARSKSLFSSNSALRIYQCDKFSEANPALLNEKNIILIINSISKEAEDVFISRLVSMPELEDWQIKDYIYSRADGVDSKKLDWLQQLCKNDMFLIAHELDKISLFDPIQRNFVFDEFVRDGMFGNESQYSIFNLSNALQSREMDKLPRILSEIDNMDVEATGLLTILINSFKKIIQVWLNNNPTSENTGLANNQIWAIKNLPRVWDRHQLINIMSFLTALDYKLKQGEVPEDMLVNYMILKILSM